MARRLTDGPFRRPPRIESGGDCRAADAILPRCGRQRYCLSKCGEQSIFARICALFDFGGPFAIIFAIRAIVIASLQRIFFAGSISHIGIESRKILPFLAHRNAAPAVSGIVGPIFLFASATHIYPNPIDRRALHPVLGVNAFADCAGDFSREAPATFRDSPFHVVGNHKSLCTAVTTA